MKKKKKLAHPKLLIIKFFTKGCEISATTARYIKNLSDLINLFGSLDGMRIAEIGGGYGGLCKIISDQFELDSYTLFDLPDCLDLSKKFLDNFGIDNVNTKQKSAYAEIIILT